MSSKNTVEIIFPMVSFPSPAILSEFVAQKRLHALILVALNVNDFSGSVWVNEMEIQLDVGLHDGQMEARNQLFPQISLH